MKDATGRLTTWSQIEEFVYGGNATFTLKSLVTGARYTYKVRVKKEDLKLLEKGSLPHDDVQSRPMSASDVVYFVNLLRGPDNEADFAYMGVLRRAPARFFWTSASGKVGRQAAAYKALLWFIDRLNTGRTGALGATLEVWHDGRCGRCGRKLTVPESVAAGLGPECLRRAV